MSNPRSPMLVGSIGLTARAVMTMGQRAYVSGGDAGLQLLDISNPANPRLAGVVETAGYAQDVVVSGPYAYLADGSRGLHLLDIQDPQRPRRLGTCRGDCQSAALGSAHVFLAPFRALDVSDPAQPKAVGRLDDAGGNRAALVGDVVWLAGDSHLKDC